MLAWLAVRWLLLRAAATRPARPGRRALDRQPARLRRRGARRAPRPVATALALAALVLAARRPGVAGAARWALAAAAPSSPTASSGVALLWSWRELDRRPVAAPGRWRLVVGAAVVAVPLHLWAGPHVFDQLQRSRRSVSLATPWRPLVERGSTGSAAVARRCAAWSSPPRCLLSSPLLGGAARPRLTAGAGPPPRRPGRRCGATLRADARPTRSRRPTPCPWYDRARPGRRLPALAATRRSTWCSSPRCGRRGPRLRAGAGGRHERRGRGRSRWGCGAASRRMPGWLVWAVVIVAGVAGVVAPADRASSSSVRTLTAIDQRHGEGAPRRPGSPTPESLIGEADESA